MEAIFEDLLIANGEGEIVLHHLANHPGLHTFDILQGHCDEVGVVAHQVMEEEGDFAGVAEAEVAPLLCSSMVLPGQLVMVPDFV